ncbi:alpha/beta-hydrolase [Aspergillus karnatakaensis]|uniref:alpha/beta fold hydrolase n=1 Tax=Aspergillus karnatakaensis TaxID=1810916 RepID=UPI003CCC99EB
MSTPLLVLPRPGDASTVTPPIPAPTETSFTSTFGTLLPPATYLQTPHGRAAYYTIPSASPSTDRPIRRILFIHGVQTPALGLYPLASSLSSAYPHAQCVLLDLWGHGLTDTPIQPHEPGLFHYLIEELLKDLKWESAHFVGYSFGGSLATTFAAKRPEAVQSLVLVAPVGLLRFESFADEEKKYLLGRTGILEEEEKAKDWVFNWLEGGDLVVPDDWRERVAKGEVVAESIKAWEMKEHKGHIGSVVGVIRDGGIMDRHEDYREVVRKGLNVFAVLGEHDFIGSVTDFNEVGVQDAVVVKGVGHGVVRERVGEVAGLVEGFWNRL